jgi:branched-chain amino acid transport system substrate-binding protein
MAPLAYAQMQVVAAAVEATGSLEDGKLSNFSSDATFNTVMGDIRFGRNGEWVHPRVLQVQFQGIEGHAAEQFMNGSTQVVVAPGEMASGRLIYPYSEAL